MSQQAISTLTLTFQATTEVARRRAVGFDGAQASIQGQKVFGVSPRPVAKGRHSDIVVSGTAIIEIGGAFKRGASLIVDAQGRAIAASDKPAANMPEYIFADALEDSPGVGNSAEVLLRR